MITSTGARCNLQGKYLVALPQVIRMEASKKGLVAGITVREGKYPGELCVFMIYFEETGQAERISYE